MVRSEARELEELSGWIIVYGRRRTGKTFMLRNLMSWDAYVLVRRDLSLRARGLSVKSARELAEAAGRELSQEALLY
mgnify:CR=1 FL=1